MSSLRFHVRASLRARIFVVGRDVVIHVIAQFRLKFVVGRWKRRPDDIVVHDVDRVRLELVWWFRASNLSPLRQIPSPWWRRGISCPMNFDDLASWWFSSALSPVS
jgi:hypothetical protein